MAIFGKLNKLGYNEKMEFENYAKQYKRKLKDLPTDFINNFIGIMV